MALLKWGAVFAILALIAALFGFGGIAEGLADVARVLFFLFLALVVILVAAGIWAWKKVT